MKPYLTIEKEAACETQVKKSRFICALYPAASFEEAAETIAAVKKKHWNATHNCSAMVIGEDGSFRRFSDDGEPQGTAGMPMLEALLQSGLTNVLAIVTRYFGGVLLGAGGLVRAYSAAVGCTLKEARKVRMEPGAVYGFSLPYASYGKLEAIARSEGYLLENAVFGEAVTADLLVPQKTEEKFLAEISEAFFGQIRPQRKGERYLTQSV